MTNQSFKVLLVEDDIDSRRCLEKLLQGAGHRVHSADSFEGALALANSHQFDVAICDIGLPVRDGWDLIRELRRRHHLPGVALSGYAMSKDVETSKEAGFCVHLLKPVDFEEVEAALELATQLVPPQRMRLQFTR